MKRTFSLGVIVCLALMGGARAQTAAAPTGAYEIVKSDIDLEVAPDGRSWLVSETRSRALTAQGVQGLQQITLSYTAGYQSLNVEAYTLKADGRKLEVAQKDILQGHGETSMPGFQDTRTMTVVFPNLEIGDQVVLSTSLFQLVPWFPGAAAMVTLLPTDVVVRDARFALTTRGDDSAYTIIASGLEARPPVTASGKTRRVWTYHNDTPRIPEPGEAIEYADLPRVEVSTLKDYRDVAKIYSDLFKDRVEVTPAIEALAKKATAGISGRRAQAKALYDWVAGHIEYVNIVLGAGGFIPHTADEVLKNGHGDCKDHVMLLQALLAAKGIKSSAVLINASGPLRLPATASPFLFDHLISYVPEFDLFLDSTARHAPFALLPPQDMGRTVVIVDSGKVAVTPSDTTASSLASETTLTFNKDGSADGDTRIIATGTNAIAMRGLMELVPPDRDKQFLEAALGSGSDGKLERGSPDASDSYIYAVHYHQLRAASFAGPGAIPPSAGFKGVGIADVLGDLPAQRSHDYGCATGSYRKTTTIVLPQGVSFSAVPPSRDIAAGGMHLKTDYRQIDPSHLRAEIALTLDHPGPVCRAADYAQVKPALSDMMDALQAQILYK